MEMLKARLDELELRKREAVSGRMDAGKTDRLGRRIRSSRTVREVQDRGPAWEGNPAPCWTAISHFTAAALAQRVGTTRSEASCAAR